MKNTFLDYGYSKEEIENRVNDTFYAIFEGHNRFYFDGINETGYFMDTGNCDARTEGMSYGMLMCVLMDKKEYFDKRAEAGKPKRGVVSSNPEVVGQVGSMITVGDLSSIDFETNMVD